MSFYSRYSVGRVITRVINDVGVLREFIAWALLAIARDLFTLIGIVIAMLAHERAPVAAHLYRAAGDGR